MKRTVLTMARAGGWLAGARRVRAAMMLLLVLVTTTTAWAVNNGPWTWYEQRSGSCYFWSNYSIPFVGLDNSHWSRKDTWCDSNTYGSYVTGEYSENKNGVFTLFIILRMFLRTHE